MTKKPKSRAETETIIRKAADEDHWTVFTEDPKYVRRLEFVTKSKGKPKGVGREWVVPESVVSFRKLVELSPEERERRSDLARERFGRKGDK
jgi:hypothetical protein